MMQEKNDYYILSIYLDPNILSEEIIMKYQTKIENIQNNLDIENGNFNYFDSGFDLFIAKDYTLSAKSISNIVDHGINCSMQFNGKSTAFYLYPRSSMGAKTPLRLSNSVGIIDAGYRGTIKGIMDNISDKDFMINKGERLLQICGPNIMYPIYPIICNDISKLGKTKRGFHGLGSTGK